MAAADPGQRGGRPTGRHGVNAEGQSAASQGLLRPEALRQRQEEVRQQFTLLANAGVQHLQDKEVLGPFQAPPEQRSHECVSFFFHLPQFPHTHFSGFKPASVCERCVL